MPAKMLFISKALGSPEHVLAEWPEINLANAVKNETDAFWTCRNTSLKTLGVTHPDN